MSGQTLGSWISRVGDKGKFVLAALAWTVLPAAVQGQVIRPGHTPLPVQAEDAAPAAQAAAAPAGQPKRVSVLVHLAPGADRGPIRAFAGNQGGFVKYEYDILPNVINLRGIPSGVLNALAVTPGVVRWEPDGQVHAHMNDSTPLISALQSQITGAGFSADGAGIRVCILDTGIDSDHAMYTTRIDTAAGRDFVNNDNNPEDDAGHGSHVAGTAVGGDTLTVDFGCVGSEPFQGVAPQATLIGIKVLNASGSGSFSDVIAGINYGADQTASGGRCDVINMSLGGGAFSGTCDSDSAAAAANAAVDAGVVVVASSGNDANTNAMGTPACGSKVIAVGATYDDDYPNCEFPNQTSFTFCTQAFMVCTATCTDNSPSVDQITCMSNRSTELDVTAPGCITFSADKDASPNGIVGFCGTSMASPHVAGLAALLLSADPTLTPAEVRQAIRDGAVDLGATGFDTVYGHGRIDAVNSLALLGPGCTTNADCDDADACTTDVCTAGSCSNTPINCDDGDACTIDSCSSGVCFHDPVNCNDGDACTTDSCDPLSGCVNDPISLCCGNGTCENGEDCNTCSADCFSGGGGFCGDGICSGGAEDCFTCPSDCRCSGRNCNNACCGDGLCAGENVNQCAVDCDPAFVPPSGGSCCGDAICEGSEDVNNCAIDCDTSCSGDAECDDGDACNGAETCDLVSGTCQSGTPVNCDDGNACTADSCDPATGLCSNDPISCDDGDLCTFDSCDPVTGCANDPVNCDDGDTCTTDSCDPATGLCVNDPIVPCCGDTFCDPGEDQCNCLADCGTPPATETNCTDGVDEDCDGQTDCADADCTGDPACPSTLCGNGVCEGGGEDCFTCPLDCRCSGPGCSKGCCGDGMCANENVSNCPVDCGG